MTPDKAAEYLEQLQVEFPGMVFTEDKGSFRGELALGDNGRIIADFRRHSLNVNLSARSGYVAQAYGNADSVQEALADLWKDANDLLTDAQRIVDKLGEP